MTDAAGEFDVAAPHAAPVAADTPLVDHQVGQQPLPGQTRFVRLRPQSTGLRFGYLSPSDSGLRDLDSDIPTIALVFENRIGGPEGHVSMETGLEYWEASGRTLGNTLQVDMYKWTIPLTFGYNTASLVESTEGKVNLFIGGGFSLSVLDQRQQAGFGFPFYSTDAGYGFQVQGSVDVPLGEAMYASAVARYEWSFLFNNSRLPGNIDDLGGGFVGLELGVRF